MSERRKRKLTRKSIKAKSAYQEFMQEKEALNLSDQTRLTYAIHIENFLNFTTFWDSPVQSLTKESYEAWICMLKADIRKKDVTIASYCRSVRTFLYWLQDKGYMEVYPLVIPKYQKTIKVCYTDAELKALLRKPINCSETEYQTWVFINLISATGMRLSSAINIKLSDIQPAEHMIYVQATKNRHAQIFFIGAEMLSILTEYIYLFNLKEDDYLFCTAERNRPSKRTVQGNVARYNRLRGVNKTSTHLLRHTFAKNYYSQTRDIYTLSHILGHASIATTEIYLRDLGVNPADATAYDPQLIYGGIVKSKKRRNRTVRF